MNKQKQKVKDCDAANEGRPPKRQRRDENNRDGNILYQRVNKSTKKCLEVAGGNSKSLLQDATKHLPSNALLPKEDDNKLPLKKLIQSLRYDSETGYQSPDEEQYNCLLASLEQSIQNYTGDDFTDSINKLNNYNIVSDDSGGEESGEESAEKEEDDDIISTPKTNCHSSSPLPLDWTGLGCPLGINCNDIHCCINNSDEDENDTPPTMPTIKSHSFIKDKHIRISGGFTIPQSNLIVELEALGAASVKTGKTLGNATILLKGKSCKDVLLKLAEARNRNDAEQNVLVLNEVELIARLHRDGCSLSPTTNTSTVIDESELADGLIKKCIFEPVNRLSRVQLKTKCDGTLPTELMTCYDDEDVVVEYAELEFKDQRIQMKQGINKDQMKQMKISVTRIIQKDESDWQYHYNFYSKSGTQQNSYCIQHDCNRNRCSECNKCTHLDPKKKLGYRLPYQQCIICCPWITCTNCGMEPRLKKQSSLDPRYTNRCGRCYRFATGNMSSEDRSIKYILDSDIPVSSANKEVFGLPIRPDAEITESPLNDISWEHDDKYGHVSRTNYPAQAQHQRTVELNKCRPWEKGKITIRQHPLDTYESVRQEKQNKLMVRVIKSCVKKELGLRGDGQGGKRFIIFIGHSSSNYHYLKALEEKENGYWDEVRLIRPCNPNRSYPEQYRANF